MPPSAWESGSASDRLLLSLRLQPLLIVLRADRPRELVGRIRRLQELGVRHVEIAWGPDPGWPSECRQLIASFPSLRLGAASVCTPAALESARQAGFRYAVSPILDRELLRRSGHDLVLVPGVMTPSEVHQARSWGCSLVKLFPAATLGSAYWRRLQAPLGPGLPFCIAAGGLSADDVAAWLAAGVDAVALGSSVSEGDDADAALRGVLVALARRNA